MGSLDTQLPLRIKSVRFTVHNRALSVFIVSVLGEEMTALLW